MRGIRLALTAVLLTTVFGLRAVAFEVIPTDGCNEGFALYVSSVSERASAKDVRLSDPVESLEPLVGYCRRRGFGISKVTPDTLGEIRNYKIVFLSGLCAVSDAEAAAFLEFAKDGGVLIADTDVAVLDERTSSRRENPLRDLFGDVLLDYLDEAGVRTVSLERPEFLPFGKGGAVKLGFTLAAALRVRRLEAVDAFLDDLLLLRGISPKATCSGLGPDGVFRVRRQGDFLLAGFTTSAACLGKPVVIEFKSAGYVYACGRGPVGKVAQVEIATLDRARMLYAQFAEEQSAPTVRLNYDALAPGQVLTLETSLLRAKSPYRLEVVLPDGTIPDGCRKSFAATGDPVDCRIPSSVAPGICTVRVQDVMTGLVGERKLTLRKLRPVPRKAMGARLRSGGGLGALVSFDPDASVGFNPSRLDADKVVDLCRGAGVDTLTLCAKCRDGFCLWPTRTSDRSVSGVPWKDGRGDVVREFADACRRGGLGFGICLSHRDLGSDWYPAPWRDQWRELASGEYGPLAVCRFANAQQDVGLAVLIEELKNLNRDMVVVGGGSAGDLRLVDDGSTCDPDVRCCFRADGDPLTPGWGGVAKGDVDGSLFLQPCRDVAPDSPVSLLRGYLRSVGNGAAMEIKLVLRKDGSLSPDVAAALNLFGKLRTAFFAEKVAEGSFDAGGDAVGLAADADFNLVVLREDLSNGEQIDGWELWLDQAGGASEKLMDGVSVGVRRIRLLKRMVRGARLRFVVTSSAGDPQDVSFELYCVKRLPSFTKR